MNTSIFHKKGWVLVFATLCGVLSGSSFPALKMFYRLMELDLQPYPYKMLFAGYRFLLASIFVIVFAFISGYSFQIKKKDWAFIGLLGVMQTTLQYGLFYVALSNITGIKGSILTTSGTFFTLLLAHFLHKNDRLSAKKVLGLLLGFGGVVMINLNKGSVNFEFQMSGEGFMLLAMFIGAVSVLVAKHLMKDINPVLVSGGQMLVGSLLLIAYSGNQIGRWMLPMQISSAILLIYLAFASATAFTLWCTLIKYNKLSAISIHKFQVPIWGVLLSTLLLSGESISITVMLSLALVALGIVFVNSDNLGLSQLQKQSKNRKEPIKNY